MKNFFNYKTSILILYKIPMIIYFLAFIVDLINKNFATGLKNILIALLFNQIIIEKNQYNKLKENNKKGPKQYLEEIRNVTNQSFKNPII